MQSRNSIISGGLAALVLCFGGFGAGPARAEVTMPECAPLGEWLATVDHAKQWQPFEGERVWLPDVFKDDEFAELFGAPVLDWTQDEARAASKHLFACGQEADEAGDRELRTRFYGARRWFKGNLVGVLHKQERVRQEAVRAAEDAEQQKAAEERAAQRKAEEERRLAERQQVEADRRAELMEALDAMVNQPDSLHLLEALTVLKETNPRDALGVNSAIGRFGEEAGRLLGYARHFRLKMHDDPIGPALDKRIGELRTSIVEDYARRIDALTASEPNALGYLDKWESDVDRRFADLLGAEVTADLKGRIESRRAALENEILTVLKSRIEEASGMESATDGLAMIQESLNAAHKSGVAPEKRQELRVHAERVQGALADTAVKEAEANLAEISEDLDGLGYLLNTIPRAEQPPLVYAAEATRESYREAAMARLDEVAEGALDGFEESIATIAANAQGLQYLERTVASADTFALVSEDIRAGYEEALAERRAEIRTAMDETFRKAREEAVARGGDEDLVGHVFENAELGIGIGFMDEERAVVGLKGKEEIAPYEVRGETIVIRGRGSTIQLTRSGEGADTTLDWLGNTLTRYER